ncbi:MAG: YraN family protein [Actinomycetia bacterium]|nr:YraN family protein [Actinomycetes bacterium]
MTVCRQTTGRRGEHWAAQHLEALGWAIVERNWRCDEGELDIVALAPHEPGPPDLVVVEVKTRSGTGYGSPLEAITAAKARRLRRLAARWRREHPGIGAGLRLDAVGVVKAPGEAPRIAHVRGL